MFIVNWKVLLTLGVMKLSKYPNITIFLGLLDIRFRRLAVDNVIDATVRLF